MSLTGWCLLPFKALVVKMSVWVVVVSAEFYSNKMTGLCPALSHREGQCADVCQERVFAVSDTLQQTVP